MHASCHRLLLLIVALLPAIAHAEQLTFRSEITPRDFSATVGGELSLPRGKGPFPAVILLHPCGGLDDVALTTLHTHAEDLANSGFATLILDSYGPRNLAGGKACGQRLGALRRDDAFNAMAALQSHANISRENIFLLGLSDGASAALLSAFGSPAGSFRAIAAYYPECERRFAGGGQVYKSPTIVFVGGKDDWTPSAECIKAKSAGLVTGAEFEVIAYPNANHGFDQPRPLRKVMGHTMAYDREATLDSRKRYIAFFIGNLTVELKTAPPFAATAR